MDYGLIPYVRAQKAVIGREWRAPHDLSREWLNYLPHGPMLPMPAIIDMLAFGRNMWPASLSHVDQLTTHLIAANVLFSAASAGDIEIYGQRCERITKPFWGVGPQVQFLALYGRIEPAEFADDRPTLSPICEYWLALAEIAARPELWAGPDGWKCADAVRYSDIKIHRLSLEKLFAKLSRKNWVPRGRPPKCDWEAVEDTIRLECTKHNCIPPDRDGPPSWKTQADVEGWTERFLGDRKEAAGTTAIKAHVRETLHKLKSGGK